MPLYVAFIDGKPGAYGVVVPDLPGCTSAAATADQALRNAVEAVRLLLHHGPPSLPRAVAGAASTASAQFASGFGLICSLNTFGWAPAPPSPWNTALVPEVVHRPLPCQPLFGSSMRPSAFLVKKPIG